MSNIGYSQLRRDVSATDLSIGGVTIIGTTVKGSSLSHISGYGFDCGSLAVGKALGINNAPIFLDRQWKFARVLGVNFILANNYQANLNITGLPYFDSISDYSDSEVMDLLSNGSPCIIIKGSKIMSPVVDFDSVSGVNMIIGSTVSLNSIPLLDNSDIINSRIEANGMVLQQSGITDCDLIANNIDLNTTDLSCSQLRANRDIIFSIHERSTKTFQVNTQCRGVVDVTGISITQTYPDRPMSIPLPQPIHEADGNRYRYNLTVDNKYDYGKFTGSNRPHFIRSGYYDIIFSDIYLAGDKFTLIAQRYCKENGYPDYEYNGMTMLNEDVLIDTDISVSDEEYHITINNLLSAVTQCGIGGRKLTDEVEISDRLTGLIYQIRSRVNNYKHNYIQSVSE